MSGRSPSFQPLSLAQHFDAPEEYVAGAGWLCGYSADAAFLENAVERYTRRRRGQRAHAGQISLAAMLDPGNPQIPPGEVPGVLHVPLKDSDKPFSLLHAKVAVLGFRHEAVAQRWCVRLIISTGNWTRQTLEDSLDLAWSYDIRSEELAAADVPLRQCCSDLRAAWSMLKWLRGYFDERALNVNQGLDNVSDFSRASSLLEEWIGKAAAKSRGIPPRFFDSRGASLLAQLSERVKAVSGDTTRNYLAMGSGYYESAQGRQGIPVVLKRIVDTLVEGELLTKRSPEIDVFVNPINCQAVAEALPAMRESKWTVREAGKPAFFGAGPRSLHAKFIFSANWRSNSDLCNSPWVYLGSGNLTGPGFNSKMAPQTGNLEAGIVLAPSTLYWGPARGISPDSVVSNLLPVQWETDLNDRQGALDKGSDMPEPSLEFMAAPIAWLDWRPDVTGGWLVVSDEVSSKFDLLDQSGNACGHDAGKGYRWLSDRPRQVTVRWSVGDRHFQALIPVVDEFGRIAATALRALDLDEAWQELENFPMPPNDEDLSPDGDVPPIPPPEEGEAIGTGTATASGVYPIRQMMQLIENIAAKQTTVPEVDWTAWCTRLEQCLVQTASSAVVKAFLDLRLNPLSPLRHRPFRPEFAATDEQAEGRRYEDVLDRIETAWKVKDFPRLGDPT